MSRRLTSAVLIVALAVQALVVAPAAFASGAGPHSTALSQHCPDDNPQGNQDCPCCPEGAAMAAGCMSLCSGLAIGCILTLPVIQATPSAAIPFIARASASRTYAPPNPPPIG